MSFNVAGFEHKSSQIRIIMQQPLKKHTPTDKGKELIAILFPLSHADRENNLVNFWKQYPKEIPAVTDGFHFIIQELVEARNMGEVGDRFNIQDNLLVLILNCMKKSKNYFQYSSIVDFFSAIEAYKPDIFANPKRIRQKIEQVLNERTDYKSKFDLPEKLDSPTRERIGTICEETATAFAKTQEVLPSILNARKQIESLRKKPGEFAEMDFNLAKAAFQESYGHYENSAKIISKHWPFIHDAYSTYPDEPEIVQMYIRYLAKLLASRESRYPVENYVQALANDKRRVQASDFEPNDTQFKKGITSLALKREYIAKVKKHINALESRYRKRKLMVKLKENTPKTAIIKELLELTHLDPVDIKTSILLARMFSEYARTIKDVQKRTSLKEQALKYANLAYGSIDDYLDLQQIQKTSERDQQRAGFLKTITAIRLPLLKSA